MFVAGLGVLAALAFVLGLGAVALWALKRFGGGALSLRPSKNRVTVEVVQRVALGPKTGIAVVRVGERVMAVSVGDGGIRPLFELDESDRQRVIATSAMPVPMMPSAEASASIAAAFPAGLNSMFGRMLSRTVAGTATPAASVERASVAESYSRFAPLNSSGHATHSYTPVSQHNTQDSDFRAILGMSLRNTTRLAVFTGAMVLSGIASRDLRAQVAPPVQIPVVQPPAVQPPVVQATTAADSTKPQAPVAPAAPQVVTPRGAASPRPARAATAATPPTTLQAPPVSPRTGNGASVSRGVAPTRPMSDMQVKPTTNTPQNARAGAASPAPIAADDAIMRMMPQMDVKLGETKEGGGLRLNGTVGIVVMMGLLTLLPTLMLMMTGFTRILIVLHFLKQAMGTQGAPPAHLLAALALLLTGFVMAPTLTEVNRSAITPWLDGSITQVEMLKTGVKPMREFMVRQTRQADIKTFVEMSRMPQPETIDDVPLHVLMSAFVASELRTAFQIGFAIYLPFIIIDTVVASVLMSMGMFMLPPAMISLPFKLLLFVLVDGWSLTIQSLVQSFK
jgi:flagellar biosynthesis protein FliP